MMRFKACFSDEEIISLLCRLRVKESRARHDEQFLRRISVNAPCATRRSQVDGMLPPRRLWIHPKEQDRARLSSSSDIYELGLRMTVLKRRAQPSPGDQPWLDRLRSFIADVQESALNRVDAHSSGAITRPEVKLIKRPDGKYRPLAIYDLKSRVIIGLTAKYLRQTLDAAMHCDSYAFRAPEGSPPPMHHDAVANLRHYRRRHAHSALWVAECDIQKFFDAIHHDVALSSLWSMVAELSARRMLVDERSISLYESYLQSYTFSGSVLNRFSNSTQCPTWPYEELKKEHWSQPESEPIGVPQGGALSCVVANIVLHSADSAVTEIEPSRRRDLFYARYCDDIIIAHPDREECDAALARYMTALKDLKLICHQPAPYQGYGRHFWSSKRKSKAPYPWAPGADNVPWVGFLGYQVRFDGTLRLRPSSVAKELKKQVQLVGSVLGVALRKTVNGQDQGSARISASRIRHRVRQRLVAMAAGKVPRQQDSDHQGHCWLAGFRLLSTGQVDDRQLRRLDRNRERQLARIKRRLSGVDLPTAAGQQMEPPRLGRHMSYHSAIRKILTSTSPDDYCI